MAAVVRSPIRPSAGPGSNPSTLSHACNSRSSPLLSGGAFALGLSMTFGSVTSGVAAAAADISAGAVAASLEASPDVTSRGGGADTSGCGAPDDSGAGATMVAPTGRSRLRVGVVSLSGAESRPTRYPPTTSSTARTTLIGRAVSVRDLWFAGITGLSLAGSGAVTGLSERRRHRGRSIRRARRGCAATVRRGVPAHREL